MPITTEDFHTSLYDLLRTRGYEPIPLDSKGKTSPFYPEADIFKFSFVKNGKKYGDVWATVDSGLKLILYYDDDVASSPMGDTKGVQVGDSWPALLKHLKRWAQRRQLGFELKNKDHLVTDMQQREFTKKKEQLGEGYHPMGKKASYNDAIPKVKIVIQHSKQLGEGEQRFRHVEKIFVENTEGERFAVPTKKPGLAKVYARHVAEGGTPYDEKGRHLSTLIEEYSKMVGFMRATKNGEFSEAVTLVVEAGRNHFTSLRETLSKLMNHRGYHNYFDSWTPVLNEEQEDSNIATLFTKQQLDPRIANCIPILSKIARVDEAKPVTELDDWADQVISETTGMEMPPKKDPRHVTYRDKKQALKHYSGELEKDQTEKNKAAALAHYQSQLQTEDSDKLQGTPIVSLSDFGDKDNKKNKYGQTVPKKLKKDDPRVKFHKDQKKGVAEGDVVPFKKKDPLTPNLIKQLKALSQQALEIFWQGSDMPTAIQGQVAGLGKNEEQRMFKQNENDLKALGYEYSINEQSPDILYLHSIAREAWYDADKPANMYRGLPDLMYDDKSNTLSYHDLIGDDGYEYDDTTTQFEGVAEGLDSDIQMGDKVEVNSPDDRDWHGREGTVIHMMDDTVVLELENGTKLRVTKDEVKKHQGVAEEETSESLNPQQKKVGQLGPLEKAKTISPVLGQKEKQHPFQGKLVGASESIDPELKRIKALINKE